MFKETMRFLVMNMHTVGVLWRRNLSVQRIPFLLHSALVFSMQMHFVY